VTMLDAPANVLAFERRAAGERVLCAFELGGEGARLPLAGEPMKLWGASVEAGEVALEPYGGALLQA